MFKEEQRKNVGAQGIRSSTSGSGLWRHKRSFAFLFTKQKFKHQLMLQPNKLQPRHSWNLHDIFSPCANNLWPQQQVSEATPEKDKTKKTVGKAEKDRLADEDGSLSFTVNNTISSSLLSFLLYFELAGLLPPSPYSSYCRQKAFKELCRVSLLWIGFI